MAMLGWIANLNWAASDAALVQFTVVAMTQEVFTVERLLAEAGAVSVVSSETATVSRLTEETVWPPSS